LINELKSLLKNPKDILKGISGLMDENSHLQKQLQAMYHDKASLIKKEMLGKIEKRGEVNFVTHMVKFDSAEEIKNLLFELRNEVKNLFCVLAAETNGKPSISVIISDELVKSKNLNAGAIVRDLAKEINGDGGGQPFYAQAWGSKSGGLQAGMLKAKSLI